VGKVALNPLTIFIFIVILILQFVLGGHCPSAPPVPAATEQNIEERLEITSCAVKFFFLDTYLILEF
jgi:hypothetical protein